jgi:hypothetical protein
MTSSFESTNPELLLPPSPPVDPNYIVCEDLFKIYKQEDLEVVALRGLDLKVRRGGSWPRRRFGRQNDALNILAGLGAERIRASVGAAASGRDSGRPGPTGARVGCL